MDFRREFTLQTPAAELWPLLSHTDRINRALDLAQVRYDGPAPGALTRLARMRVGGVLELRWEEPPFEWVERQFYSVRRPFANGPFAELEAGMRLVEEGPRTRVEISVAVAPRGLLGRLAAEPVSRRNLEALERLCRQIEGALRDKSRYAFARAGGRASVDASELTGRLERVRRACDADALAGIARHLQEAYDEDVVRMRPFALADAWRLDRLAVLKAFLHASRAGAVDLSWEILCPNCRVASARTATLKDLAAEAHCGVCRIGFSARFDENVEARFTANPAVRAVVDQTFCIGGPANTPHRCLQLRVPARGERRVALALGDRRYYLRGLSQDGRLALRPGPGGASVRAELSGGAAVGPELVFRPGAVELTLVNPDGEPAWVALDHEAWSDLGATAAQVTVLQEFRDLFSSEVLAPGQHAAIRSLAFMFTDLKGSTELYERIGDAAAYALVRTHFLILTSAIQARNGSIVKTIGDAVMAAFGTEADAARAAVDIQRAVAEYNRENAARGTPIIVKIGLHAGPAIAITANEALDYFGTTVNASARVQGASEGSDVVVTAALHERPAARAALEEWGTVEAFSVQLKGLSGRFPLWRYRAK